MLASFCGLVIVGWLPGAVLFRARAGDRSRRASLPAEERLYWAIVLSIAVSLSIVLALAAMHRYSYERLLIGDVLAAAAAAVTSRFRLRLPPNARRPGLTALLPLAIVAIGIWRFFPPSEYVIGGKDPGVYMNEGIRIAQRGALVVDDPEVAALPAFARDLFFPRYGVASYYSSRFMGFFLKNPDTGAVVSQFPHLFPAAVAIGYGVDGLTGARRVTGVWAILGLLGVYFLGARLFGIPAALAGAGLLSLNVAYVWFSRYPNSEMVLLALLFAALLATAHAYVDRDRFFAPIAASLLSLLLFLRIDALLAIVAVMAALALLGIRGERIGRAFWIPALAGTAAAGWYLLGPLRAYVELPIIFLTHFSALQDAAIAAAAVAVAGLLVATRRNRRAAAWLVVTAPTALSVVLAALAVYALAFRAPGGKLTEYDAYALRTFAAYYVTVPGVLAALIGLLVFARRLFWRDPAFVMVLAAYSLFFFYKVHIVPNHFWMARRFIPVILPGVLLLVGTAAVAGTRGGGTRRAYAWRLIGAAFLALLASQYARAARPVLAHVEYAGIIPRLEQLASRIGDADLVVVESRNASDVHVLALPLAYIYARNVLVLATPVPDKPAFARFLAWAHTKYSRVLFLGGGGTDLLSSRWSVEPVASERFQVPEYESPYDAYPRAVRQKEFDYGLYALEPPRGESPRGFDLDVGLRDDLYVLRFHAKEESQGHTFRWSRDRSYISIARVTPADRTVTIWMNSGGRPASAPPAIVRVLLDGHLLGSVRVTDGFHPYRIPIPPEVAGAAAASGEPVRLTLETATWNPLRTLGASDARDLGVIVDRITVE
jgi:hypothetical protein